MSNAVSDLKRAVTAKDAGLMGKAVGKLRAAGHTDRECYRIALAADPNLTLPEWNDYMVEAGVKG